MPEGEGLHIAARGAELFVEEVGEREVKSLAFLAAAGTLVATSPAASAKELLVFEPASPWELNYDTESCALRRSFGGGDRLAQIELRRFQPGIAFQVIVASNATRPTKRRFRYHFGPAGQWEVADLNTYSDFADGFKGVIFRSSLFGANAGSDHLGQTRWTPEDQFEEAAAAARVQGLTVSGAFRDDLQLRTGSLEAAFTALNKCIDDLVTQWGIDTEAHRSLSRHATPINPLRAAATLEVPPGMIRSGVVNFRLGVDASGAVTGCYIQSELRDPVLEQATCQSMRKALRFEPALDKDGNPIASYWVSSVNFDAR